MPIVLTGTGTFVDCVNRILRINTIIKGDDDDITVFSDTQHAASISLAQIAIQDELGEIVSERLIPYEHTTGTISLVTNTRSYGLASDFIRFFGKPSFYDATDNRRIFQYPGGEQNLMNVDYQYKTNTGTPTSWYYDNTISKKAAFYNVPDSNYNGRSLSYDYEKSIMVTNAADDMPFHNPEEFYAFASMAARRLKFLMDEKDTGSLPNDATYSNAKSRLYDLIRVADPKKTYGKRY